MINQNLQKKVENSKKPNQSDNKTINYKNLIAQYYDRDINLNDVHDQIKPIAPQIQILDKLTSFEKQLDALIKTKRYDVQQIYMKPPKILKRILRIKLIKQQGKLKIFGNLYPKPQQNSPKFTVFFKQIKIVSTLQKNTLYQWKKPLNNFVEKDGIAYQFPADFQPQSILISLHQIYNPQRFEVDQSLLKIVNMKRGTRVEILQAFWQYVKLKKLQDMQNKQIINADQPIKNAFKAQKLTFASINNRIRELLVLIEPIKIQMKGFNVKKTFDIVVQAQQRPNIDILPFFAQKLNEQKNDHPYLSLNSKIKKYEKKYQDQAQKLRRHLAKRQIYKNFKADEVQKIIKQQYRLLKILKEGKSIEDYNKLEYILQNEDEVEKQIKHYLEQINIERNQPHD